MPFPKGESWWAGVGALARYTLLELDIIRFLESVEFRPDGCWMWTGRLWENGYGRFEFGGHKTTQRKAHKIMYEWCHGPVTLDLDHMCHNRDLSCPGGWMCMHRACVNPYHLEPSTRSMNLLRGQGSRAFKAAVELVS